MIRRVFRYVATLGGAGLLVGMGALLSPLVWPTDPDGSLAMRDGRLVGEVSGYVWHADPNTATIHVSFDTRADLRLAGPTAKTSLLS